MSIPLIGEVISGASKILDKFFPSPEDKAKAEALLAQVQNDLEKAILTHREKLFTETGSVIKTEMSGQSNVQRNWRPHLMYVFMGILVWNYMAFPILHGFFPILKEMPVPPEMWNLLNLGVGGYIGGRTLEKVLPDISRILKK